MCAEFTSSLRAQGAIASPALDFNGVNQHVFLDVPNSAMKFTNFLTVEAWIKPRSMKCNTNPDATNYPQRFYELLSVNHAARRLGWSALVRRRRLDK